MFLKRLKPSLGIPTSGQWTRGSYSQRRAALTVSSVMARQGALIPGPQECG